MLDKKHIKYFKKILPVDFVLSEEGDCWAYGYDNSKMHVMPECVLFADSKTQIQDITRYCFENTIPITTRGRGTGNTGGSVPIENSVVLSLEKMNKIIDIDISNRLAVVQPGVINKTLQDELKKENFKIWLHRCFANSPRSVIKGLKALKILSYDLILPW